MDPKIFDEFGACRFLRCEDCGIQQRFAARYAKRLRLPCEDCVSPGRIPEIFDENLLAYQVFQRTSGQLVFMGGGLAGSIPVAIEFSAIEFVLRAMKVPEEQWLDVTDKVQILFQMSQDKSLLDREAILKEARDEGRTGKLVV